MTSQQINKIQDSCSLCDQILSSHPIVEGENIFCCLGCHAVFRILTVKGQIEGFEHHPIFLQALKSGLISNPALLDHIRKLQIEIKGDERERVYIEIGEMWCPSCAEIIKLMLLKEKGVVNCVVDYTTDLASIEFSPRYFSKDKAYAIIKQLGYSPIKLEEKQNKAVSNDLYMRFGVAAFCALNNMMLAYPLYATYFDYDGEGYGVLFSWLSLFISLPVLFYSAWPIWRRFVNSLKTGLFGMETLVALGVFSATILSVYELLNDSTQVYFDSMTVIITFVLLGKIIEAKAKFSAKDSLLRLNRAIPRRARKFFNNGLKEFVLIKEIAIHDKIAIYQGEKIPLDGQICEGEGACDESLMTGEALPVIKGGGDFVLAGSVLTQGNLVIQIVKDPEDNALSQIINMVEKDIGHKSSYVRAADKIVKWFVPSVILISALSALIYYFYPNPIDQTPFETACLRALAVLLISCPCAIGIAAPAAESYLLNSLASIGIIIKNRGCLPNLGGESVLVFDKTGTVTEGKFTIKDGLQNLSVSDKDCLYALASKSTHPVAVAVSSEICPQTLPIVTDIKELIGYGLKGKIDGKEYMFGSARFLNQYHIITTEKNVETEEITSTVYFAKNGQCIGTITLVDKIREQFSEVLKALRPTKAVLLSGDTESSVARVAQLTGFDSWQSKCTPLEKQEYIVSLRKQGEVVCVIGDGINDAPALTAANIGISVVSATDISIQVSDILLTTERLSVLLKVRKLAKKGKKVIRENLFWAFFYNVIGIFLACCGILSPIFAAFAMSISSLTVLFNARRLKL